MKFPHGIGGDRGATTELVARTPDRRVHDLDAGEKPKHGKARPAAENASHAIMVQDTPAIHLRPLFRHVADASLEQSARLSG